MKKGMIAVFVFLFLVLTISFISAVIMHNAGEVKLKVDTVDDTLQGGIGKGTFGLEEAPHNFLSGTNIPTGGHDASQIWVSVQDGEMNLLAALNSMHKLCPNPSKPTAYYSPSIPSVSHTALEISLASGKTFQQAINDGDFCLTPTPMNGGWSGPFYSCCTGTCDSNGVPGTTVRDVWYICNNPAPANGGADCEVGTRTTQGGCSNWFSGVCTDHNTDTVSMITSYTSDGYLKQMMPADFSNSETYCNLGSCACSGGSETSSASCTWIGDDCGGDTIITVAPITCDSQTESCSYTNSVGVVVTVPAPDTIFSSVDVNPYFHVETFKGDGSRQVWTMSIREGAIDVWPSFSLPAPDPVTGVIPAPETSTPLPPADSPYAAVAPQLGVAVSSFTYGGHTYTVVTELDGDGTYITRDNMNGLLSPEHTGTYVQMANGEWGWLGTDGVVHPLTAASGDPNKEQFYSKATSAQQDNMIAAVNALIDSGTGVSGGCTSDCNYPTQAVNGGTPSAGDSEACASGCSDTYVEGDNIITVNYNSDGQVTGISTTTPDGQTTCTGDC
jgi:hypothetical protein